jgi:hypothetical protein
MAKFQTSEVGDFLRERADAARPLILPSRGGIHVVPVRTCSAGFDVPSLHQVRIKSHTERVAELNVRAELKDLNGGAIALKGWRKTANGPEADNYRFGLRARSNSLILLCRPACCEYCDVPAREGQP